MVELADARVGGGLGLEDGDLLLVELDGQEPQEVLVDLQAALEFADRGGRQLPIAPDFAANDPFKKPAEEYIGAYKSAQNNQMPNLFGAHVWDVVALLGRAAPNALKAGKPGSPEFRAALRDELEKSKDVYLNNGLSNMSPTDHNGYDERSAFLIKVQDGQFRLAK